MKIRFLLLAVSLLATSSFANLPGRWSGKGKLVGDNGAYKQDCQSIGLEMSQSSSVFSIDAGHFKCGDVSSTWEPLDLDVRGGSLYLGDEKIGTLRSNRVSFVLQDSDMSFHFAAEIFADGLHYAESWILPDSTKYLEVTGLLKSN